MFHAFLSYSHRADAGLAALLQRALERLGTPWWRRAPVRVFRDDATLAPSAALWTSIEAGLARSESFVLLASPAAAVSPWVEREVRWWIEHRDRRRLYLVATGGEIAYDAAAQDFDWQRTTCLPPVLRGVFAAEPLWVDLRFAAALQPLTLRHTRLRSAALALAAAVRGMDKDVLESVDLREHRRSIMMAGAALALIATLGLATTAAVWTARSESANARTSQLRAESRRLAAEAFDELNAGGPGIEAAVLKAALAWRLAPTEEARSVLGRINGRTAAVARVLGRHTAGVHKVSLSPDGRVLATAGREGAVLRWDLATGRTVGGGLAGQGWPDRLVHSSDGTHLLLHSHERVEDREHARLALFRLIDGITLPLPDGWRGWLEGETGDRGTGSACSALSADGGLVAVGLDDRIAVIDVAEGRVARHRLPPRAHLAAIGFTPQHYLVLMIRNVHGYGAQAAHLTQPMREGHPLRLGPRHPRAGGDCRFASFGTDGRRLAGIGGAWQIDDRLVLSPSRLPAAAWALPELTGHHAPELDAAGRLVAIGIGGTAQVWNFDSGQRVFQAPRQNDHHGPPLTLSADGSRLAGLQDGTPVVWALDGKGQPQTLMVPDCGPSEVLAEHCLARLCDKLTTGTSPARWRELLGTGAEGLLAIAKQLRCGVG